MEESRNYEQLQKDYNSLQKELESLALELHECRKQLGNTLNKDNLDSLQKQLAAKKILLNELTAEHDKELLETEYRSQIERLKEDLEAKEKLLNVEEEIIELESSVEEEEEQDNEFEIIQLNNELVQVQEQVDEEVNEIEDVKMYLNVAESAIKKLQEDNEHLKEAIDICKDKNEHLESQKEDLLEELTESKMKREGLTGILGEKQANSLFAEVNDGREVLENKIANMKEQMMKMQSNSQVLIKEIELLEQRNTQLQKLFEKHSDEAAEFVYYEKKVLKQRKNQLQFVVDKYIAELVEVSKLETIEFDPTNFESLIESKEKEISDITVKYKTCCNSGQLKQDTLKDLKEQLEILKVQLESKQKEYDALKELPKVEKVQIEEEKENIKSILRTENCESKPKKTTRVMFQ